MKQSKETIAALDGVRAIACFLVVAYHLNRITLNWHDWGAAIGPLAGNLVISGWSGVTLFFILSGFLLFRPYVKALLFEERWPEARRFYLRRILRIWPGYYVSLIVLILWQYQEYLQPAHWRDLGLFLTFFMDATPETYQQINGPFWTLAVEWQFYLLLPILALAFSWVLRLVGKGSLQRRWWALVSCLVLLMAWGIFTLYWGEYFVKHPGQTFLVPRRVLDVFLFFCYGSSSKYLQDFAVGMLVCSCFVLVQHAVSEGKMGWLSRGIVRSSFWLWGVGVFLLFTMATWNARHWFPSLLGAVFHAYHWFSELGFALGFGLCLLAILVGPAIFRRPFEWKLLRWLGFISYSLYIWHLPLLNLLKDHVGIYAPHWRNIVVMGLFWMWVAVVIVPFAFLFYRLVERPWIKSRLMRISS